MASHHISQEEIEQLIGRMKRFRSIYCILASIGIAGFILLMVSGPDWIMGRFPHSRTWPMEAALWLFGFPLLFFLRKWKSAPANLEERYKSVWVTISGAEVQMSYDQETGIRHLELSQISRLEEPRLGHGLYLCSPNRYRWLLIPRKVDGYEAAKEELCAMGIPLYRTSIPPNWEEFLGMLGFCATIIGGITLNSRPLLVGNLIAAALVSGGMFFVIGLNPDNFPYMRWRRFAAFIPLAAAMFGLWLR